jgi:translation initiation factor 6
MAVLKTSFNSNPNLGLYGYATDKYVLVGNEVPQQFIEEFERVFAVPVHKLNIAGTSMLGVFLTGYKDTLLVPHIAFDYELEQLDKLKIKYKVFKSDLTCLGNNIIFNKKYALVNPEFSDNEIKELKELLGVTVKRMSIAETDALGSSIVLRGNYGLINRDASKEEVNTIEKALKVKLTLGSINMGSPYVKSGILCNKNGFIVGDLSGGPELVNAEEALGYLDN